MSKFLFSIHFLKLRLGVLLHIKETANPIDLKWQWKNWQVKNRWQQTNKF